jgi:hypothetical protein
MFPPIWPHAPAVPPPATAVLQHAGTESTSGSPGARRTRRKSSLLGVYPGLEAFAQAHAHGDLTGRRRGSPRQAATRADVRRRSYQIK